MKSHQCQHVEDGACRKCKSPFDYPLSDGKPLSQFRQERYNELRLEKAIVMMGNVGFSV